MTLPKPMLYAAQGEPDGPVKFGITSRPTARLLALQSGHPGPLRFIKIRQVRHSTVRLEQEIHAALRSVRLRGEWFHWSEEVRQVLWMFDALAECW